jgi:hypothetical protein
MAANWLTKIARRLGYSTSRRQRRASARRRPLTFEALETRITPAINYANIITGLKTDLGHLQADLLQVDAKNALPVVCQPLADLPPVAAVVGDIKTPLLWALSTLEQFKIEDAAGIRTNLYNALGPGGSNVLGDTNKDNKITSDDVSVTVNGDDLAVSVRIHETKTTATDFGLGLPGVPLKIFSKGDSNVQTTVDYQNFSFSIKNNQYLLDTSKTGELMISVDANVKPKTSMIGAIGFLPVNATDDPASHTKFHGDFKIDVSSGGHITANAATLTGSADVNLKMATLDVPVPGTDVNLPKVSTDFHAAWKFSSANPNVPLDQFGDPPTASFKKTTINIGSLFADLLEPHIKDIQQAIKPVESYIKTLNEPLDGFPMSDGGADKSIVEMMGDAGIIPKDLENLIQLAGAVDIAIQNLDSVSNALSKIVIHIDGNAGPLQDSIVLSGNLRTSTGVLDYLKMGTDLTTAVAKGLKGMTFDAIRDQILKQLSGPTKTAAQAIFDFLDPNKNGNIKISTPFFDNPQDGVVKILMGQDTDLFHLTATFKGQTKPSLSLFIPAPVGGFASLDGQVNLDIMVGVGYDTFGLRTFLNDLLKNPNNPKAEDLTAGLYLDKDSHANIDGVLTGNFTVVAVPFGSLDGDGVIAANAHLTTVDPDMDNKRRLFTEGPAECLFKGSGGLHAAIKVTVTPGPPFAPSITVVDKAKDLVFDFGPNGCIADPFFPQPALQLAGDSSPGGDTTKTGDGQFDLIDHNTGVLRLNMGPRFALRNFPAMDGVKDEVFTVTHEGSAADGTENVVVSAFGLEQHFTGVRSIEADGGDGKDAIVIGPDVTADASLHGGAGNDILTYLGVGNKALLFGDDNNDQLTGGKAANTSLMGGDGNDELTSVGSGPTMMFGGAGNDVLRAGFGSDSLFGESGDDKLFAGAGVQFLDGGAGNDALNAAPGTSTMSGGAGDDTFNWKFGDGAITGDGGIGKNALNLYGSIHDDTFTLSAAGAQVSIQAPGAPLTAANIHEIDVEGAQGADSVTVNAIDGVGVGVVDVNLGQFTNNDNAKDRIIVNGTVHTDEFVVTKEKVSIQQAHDKVLTGALMDVLRGDFLVRTSNDKDDLAVNGLGGDDLFAVRAITGPTSVNGDDGADHFFVSAKDLGDYTGPLTVTGSTGKKFLSVDESPAASNEVVDMTATTIHGKLLGDGISYQSGEGFQSVSVATGSGNDVVNVKAARPEAITSVNTGGGNDSINVSSNIAAKTGTLADIAGPLAVDLGAGANMLHLNDRGASSGNSAVIIDGNHIGGMAGPSDAVDIAYAATGGTFSSIWVESSDAASVHESFLVQNPNGPLTLKTMAGDDHVVVDGLPFAATINTGAGDDVVRVRTHAAAATILSVNGGPQNSSTPGDTLIVEDADGHAVIHVHKAGSSGHADVYYLNGATSLVKYSSMETVVPSVDAITSFVESLFHNVLHENPTAQELSQGVALAQQPNGRATLAAQLEHSLQGRAITVIGWNSAYFNGQLTNQELKDALQFALTHTDEQTLVNIFVQKNPNPSPQQMPGLINFVYQAFLNRAPTFAEKAQGLKLLGMPGGVAKFVEMILIGKEFRSLTIKEYFTSILRRTKPPAPGEVTFYANSSDDLLKVRVRMEATTEFFDDGY